MNNYLDYFLFELQPALALIGAAAAAPQFIADTPEVQEAKIAFAEAFNKAARGSAIALQEAGVVTDPNDADYSPAAEAYVHVDVPAEPYVHIEPVCDEAGHCDGAAPAAPVQLPAPVPKAAPAVVPQQFVPAPAPVQQFAAPIQTSTAPVQQVWPLTQFFLFLFCENSLICLEGKSMTPHRGNTILFRSSPQLPRLRLGPSKGFLS